MKLTLSVSSFQVPAAPGAMAWPPSFPSTPTSRATRVTSEVKRLNWSTMMLTFSFNWRNSPRPAAVIFLEKSPLATALVMSAILRTWLVKFEDMKLTLSVNSFQVPAAPGAIAWPLSLPSVPTSRATRVTSEVKRLSWSTMVLTFSFNWRNSPRPAAVIFLEKSPLATALVMSAILRTWLVKFEDMKLTLSVNSFQVPAAPGAIAWPLSLPSVPTSRATRVTSEVKRLSWSTMVLTFSFNWRNSPRPAAVIFLEKSPLATALVMSAILRTWLVKFEDMKLTLSVNSFQVPAAPGAIAWPLSLPSVPTSRATRVTSEVKRLSWSTIVLTFSFNWRNSPRTSAVIFLEKSPLATAVVMSAILRTWFVRLLAMKLTLSVISFQVPAAPTTWACPPSFPSVPTSRATLVTSEANARSWSTMVLTVSFKTSTSPRTSAVIFLERSPWATERVTSAILRTWLVRLLAMKLTLSARSFQ